MIYEFVDIKQRVIAFDGRVIEVFNTKNPETDRYHIRHIKAIALTDHRKGQAVSLTNATGLGGFLAVAADDQYSAMQAFYEAVNEVLSKR